VEDAGLELFELPARKLLDLVAGAAALRLSVTRPHGQRPAGAVVGSAHAMSTVGGKNINSPQSVGLKLICTRHAPVPTIRNIPLLAPSWNATWALDGAVLEGSKSAMAQWISAAGS
jgi:hypothetical protein